MFITKILGQFFQNDLGWGLQIEHMVKKSLKKIWMLGRMRQVGVDQPTIASYWKGSLPFGVLQSGLQLWSDQAAGAGPGQGPMTGCNCHLWPSLSGTRGQTQPEMSPDSSRFWQDDSREVTAPLHPAGQPPKHPEWQDGVEGSKVSHTATPTVGLANIVLPGWAILEEWFLVLVWQLGLYFPVLPTRNYTWSWEQY